MSAKQCLRHEWLREAPTQASAHLRKYLSKSREVLLERVVSRENLRRAALLSQTAQQQQQQQQLQHQQSSPAGDCMTSGLSQSEMYLNRGSLAGSRGSLSLSGCDDYETSSSLASSRSSLATSQSCLLNKEQTQGLLSQALDRRSLRASMAQGLNSKVGVLSKIRGLSQVQSRSQACLPLLNDARMPLGVNRCFDGSREKLYGLKSLSKSQGMLDIYRSLESLQRHNNKRGPLHHQRNHQHLQKERSRTEDVLPCFRQLGHGSSSGSLNSSCSSTKLRPDTAEASKQVSSRLFGKKLLLVDDSRKDSKLVFVSAEAERQRARAGQRGRQVDDPPSPEEGRGGGGGEG